jgi:hypothetical protein
MYLDACLDASSSDKQMTATCACLPAELRNPNKFAGEDEEDEYKLMVVESAVLKKDEATPVCEWLLLLKLLLRLLLYLFWLLKRLMLLLFETCDGSKMDS